MATRMQQRRGTAAQWTAANPVLAAGEIGFETDTNKFKMGDGVNTWANLTYFVDQDAIDGSLGDYVESSLLGVADGVATLDANGKLTATQIPNIDELSQDAVNSALTAGTGIIKNYNDNANTITISVDTASIATQSYVTTAISNLVDAAPATLDTLNELAAALGDDANFATTVTNALAGKANTSHTHAIADVTNLQTELNGKASTSHTHAISDVTNLQTELNARATLTGTQTLTNKTLTSPNILGQTKEDILVSGTGFAGYTFDVMSDAIQFITANATNNGTINFRGDSSTSLNTFMAVNQSITCVLLITNGATPYRPNAFQIDGSSVTPRWQGGTAPTSGNANSTDVYTFTILKTASATYTVLASQTRFA